LRRSADRSRFNAALGGYAPGSLGAEASADGRGGARTDDGSFPSSSSLIQRGVRNLL